MFLNNNEKYNLRESQIIIIVYTSKSTLQDPWLALWMKQTSHLKQANFYNTEYHGTFGEDNVRS